VVESSWNVTHGSGKWRGNWRMEWVASTLHTTSEHGVSSITTADINTPVASSRLNWSSHRFKWNFPFRRKTKSGFCACAITFQTQSTSNRRVSSPSSAASARSGANKIHLMRDYRFVGKVNKFSVACGMTYEVGIVEYNLKC
jgi:hypothetical protein